MYTGSGTRLDPGGRLIGDSLSMVAGSLDGVGVRLRLRETKAPPDPSVPVEVLPEESDIGMLRHCGIGNLHIGRSAGSTTGWGTLESSDGID